MIDRSSRALALALVCLALPLTARAQATNATEFSGLWHIDFSTSQGPTEMDLHLRIEDDEIQGEATGMGMAFPLEGHQDGAEVEFVIYISMPDHEVDLYFEGTLDGDTAEGGGTVMSETFTWSAKRAGDPSL